MDDTQSFPLWLIPIAFPVFFVALWTFICAILSAVGGWSELGRHYRDPDGMARAPLAKFRTASAGLTRGWTPFPVGYNNCLIVEVAETGIHLRTWMPFRFRHPPLFIPWTHVERAYPGQILFFRTLVLHPAGVGTRIHLYRGPAEAVEQVLMQLLQQQPHPAGV